jgi:GH25 family lysozyme M1 (1,4-beta-N-acetylmuramidase)
MIEGIDVSSAALNYTEVAAAKAFVFQKLTDGVGSPCAAALPHCNGLRAVGMGDVLGGYHFLRVRHGHAQDADEQCRQFMDARANAGCPLSPWLDVELGEPGSSNRAATHDEVKAAVMLWLETWEASCSDTVTIYSSPGEAAAMGLTLIDELARYPLALAAYNGGGSTPAPPHPWTAPYAYHQYLGDVPMFGGIVDQVRFFGTVDQLKAL